MEYINNILLYLDLYRRISTKLALLCISIVFCYVVAKPNALKTILQMKCSGVSGLAVCEMNRPVFCVKIECEKCVSPANKLGI